MAGKATEAAGDAFGLLSNTELRWRTVKDGEGHDVEITSSAFGQAMQSKDRRYRHDAFVALLWEFPGCEAHAGRHAGRGDAARLVLLQGPRLSHLPAPGAGCREPALGVYDNLIKTVNEHGELLHRYVALKKNAS